MLTLGNQRNLTNDMLIKGIIDSVITVNQFYAMLPFKGIQGNALAYNRETRDFDQQSLVGAVNTGHTSINKDAQTFTRHSTELTTLIGDAQVNGLIQAVGSDYNDATAVQVAAKAKGLGRTFMNLLINGSKDITVRVAGGTITTTATDLVTDLTTGASLPVYTVNDVVTAPSNDNVVDTLAIERLVAVIDGATFIGPFLNAGNTLTESGAAVLNAIARLNAAISSTNTAGQTTNGWTGFDGLNVFARAAGNNLDARTVAGVATTDVLSYLDMVIDRVHDKDGMVDYLMLNSAGVREITKAFRDAGTGFDMMDVKTSSGAVMAIQSYRGVPIFRNDFIGFGDSSLTGGDNSDSSTIYAGTLDDGSFSHGICGLTALQSAGMQVQKLGARENVDADITRVKWYCGLAHFSELGLVKGTL